MKKTQLHWVLAAVFLGVPGTPATESVAAAAASTLDTLDERLLVELNVESMNDGTPKVSWEFSDAVRNELGVKGFNVYRADLAVGLHSTKINDRPIYYPNPQQDVSRSFYVDREAKKNHPYIYSVAPVDDAGSEGPWSSVGYNPEQERAERQAIKDFELPNLAPPTQVLDTDHVKLEWEFVEDQGIPLRGFFVERRDPDTKDYHRLSTLLPLNTREWLDKDAKQINQRCRYRLAVVGEKEFLVNSLPRSVRIIELTTTAPAPK